MKAEKQKKIYYSSPLLLRALVICQAAVVEMISWAKRKQVQNTQIVEHFIYLFVCYYHA